MHRQRISKIVKIAQDKCLATAWDPGAKPHVRKDFSSYSNNS